MNMVRRTTVHAGVHVLEEPALRSATQASRRRQLEHRARRRHGRDRPACVRATSSAAK